MYKFIFILLSSISFLVMAEDQQIVINDKNAEDILRTTDSYRSESDSAKISAKVKTYKADKLTKERDYDIYVKSNDRSLIVFKSPAEKGQKVLMKGNDYWMFMPKSRRPIRITPMQKLLGEASLGDIATLNWSGGYKVEHAEQVDDSIMLQLKAKSPKLSYQHIELLIDENDFFPKKMKLYLRSSMHSKTAIFDRGVINGNEKVIAMTLLDKMQPDNKTVIGYQSVTALSIPDKLFNPHILIRSDLNQLLTD